MFCILFVFSVVLETTHFVFPLYVHLNLDIIFLSLDYMPFLLVNQNFWNNNLKFLLCTPVLLTHFLGYTFRLSVNLHVAVS
jgi:hypothetical protein